MYKLISKSFTLIELLIVIVIIGIITTAIIPKIKGMQNRAKYIRVEKDFQDFKTAVFMAQSSHGKTLGEITGTYCASCKQCQGDLRLLGPGTLCYNKWVSTLRLIEDAAGLNVGTLSTMELDPWGSPYLLDENEGSGSDPCSSPDYIHSAGPDGYLSGVGGTYGTYPNDNVISKITKYKCPGSY